jgi:hypothetical protein
MKDEKMQHVMLDLETWGTKPGSALRSIGMVQFDPFFPGFGKEFYCNIDDESQLAIGAIKDQKTIEWWTQQSKKALEILEVEKLNVHDACDRVIQYFNETGVSIVWAQGSNFDPVLLEAIFDMAGKVVPWKFYNTRDTRTIYSVANYDTRKMPRVGEHHNALEDAKHQVRCVYRSYQILHNREKDQ